MAVAYDGDGNRVFQLNYNLHTDEDWKGNSGNGNGNNKDNAGSGNNGKGSSKNSKGNNKSEGTDDAGYGNATNAEENNSQNQSGILFPIDEEVSETEQYLIDQIKTTGKQKNYELIEYLNDVNREYVEVLVEQNINGKTDTSYIYGVNRLSLDRFDGSTGYYLYDPRGSVSGITNEEGQIYQSYRYSVIGEITFGAPQYENEYTYNGESYNPNIESQYLRARYYNVVTATFLTEDSYLGNINEPLTLNRYNYCVSSYLNYKDPSGKLGEPSGIWLITELLDEGQEVIDEIVSFSWNTIKYTKIQCAEAEAEYEARKAEHMANVYASYATPEMQTALAVDSTVGLSGIYNYVVSPLRYGAQGSEHPFIDTFENRKDNTTYFYLGAEELLFDVTDTIKNPELIKSRAIGTAIAVIENPELLKPDLIGAAVDAWNFVWYSPDEVFFGTSSKVLIGVGASVTLAKAKGLLKKDCGKVDLSDGDISRRATMETLEGGTDATKPYATGRPSYGNGQVEQVWENAKDSVTGKVYDPSGAEITWDPTKPRNGQWDMGHIPGEKYSEMHQLYMDGIISKKEFLDWYRNPDNYRPELPGTNRSHKYE